MADINDAPSFGNFSIQDTMEMGMGNRELIDDLFSETVTSTSEEVTKIGDEPKPTKPAPKAKEVEKPKPQEKKKEEEEEEEEEDPNKALNELFEKEEEEEEGKEGKEKEKESEEEEEEDSKTPANTFNTISKELFRLGVFTKDEEEEEVDISTPEAFLDRFNQEKKKGAIEYVDRFIGQFGDDYKHAFDSIFVKGVDPKEYFGAYNNIKDFASLDLTQEANQVAVVKQALADQGYEPEEINAEVDRLKNYGDLDTVAQRHHKVLIKKEAAKVAELEKASERRLQQEKEFKSQYIKNVQTILQDKVVKKEFDGIPLNPKIATELQDFLLTDRYKTPTGETLTEFDKTILDLKRPENHERKVKVALLLKLLEKDPTLSTIQKAGVSKKSDALFSELARQTKKTSVKKEQEKPKPSSWFSNL